MKIDKRIIYLVEGAVLFFLIWAVVGIVLNSRSLSSVVVTLSPDGVEYRDKTVLGIGKADEPPDYRLRLRTSGGWVELGSYANTWIGDGLEFTPKRSIPVKDIVEFQLLDDDKFEHDVLEQFPFDGDQYVGKNYSLSILTGTDAEAGFAWFFKTPVGVAILAGITISIVLIVIYFGVGL